MRTRGIGIGTNGMWRGANVLQASSQNAPTPVGQTYIQGMPVATPPIRPMGAVLPGVGTGVPGKPIAHASGNPTVSSIPYIPPPQNPKGQPRVLNVGQESAWRGGADFSNEKLTTHDRHLFSKIGYENSGRDSGLTDPPKDGPARPSYQTINRTVNYQQGTDNDLNQDDLSRPYTRNPQGMYIGEQGTGWTQVSGGVPGLWQPYGSYAGYTSGPVQGIQSPYPQGGPGDGRHSVFSGPPHGLHSPTMPDYVATLGYYMAVPQMRQPRMDRPSNATGGGQSYSQTVVPQGQTGTIAQGVGLPTSGVNWQSQRSQGWRGQAGAGNAS